jgi:hypothetical protein
MEQLERTRTNAATDAKGQAFGLSGNLFLYPVIGVVASLATAMFCFMLLKLPLLIAICAGLPVLILPLVYVLALRHNKPRGYDRDWLHNITSQGFSFVKASQPVNPRLRGEGNE